MRGFQGRWRQGGAALGAVVALMLAVPATGSEQTFQEAVSRALSNGCGGLHGGSPASDYDGSLSAICAALPGAGASSGGSTLSSPRDAATYLERRVLQRLEERREAFVASDTRGAAADNQTLTLGTVGLYVSGNGEWIDQGSNRFETGYKSRDKGLTLGADVALNPMIVVGLAASFTRADAEYKEDGGGFSSDAYGITLYGSVAPIANLFIDATVGYVFRMHELRRRNTFDGAPFEVNSIARSETESNEINTAVRAGYDFIVGPLTAGPRAGVAFRSQAIDSFREFGRDGRGTDTGLELIFSDQTRESLTTSLGVYLSYAIPLPLGVLVPQVTAEYVHEFLDDQRVVYFRFVEDQLRAKLRFQTAPPDRDYGNISAGILWVLPRNISAFLNYRTLVGYEERTAHSITGGIRVTFK